MWSMFSVQPFQDLQLAINNSFRKRKMHMLQTTRTVWNIKKKKKVARKRSKLFIIGYFSL